MNHEIVPNMFVMGMPRSGTTLLRTLLNNHTKIFIPDIETDFIPGLIREFEGRALTGKEVSRAVKKIKNSMFFFYYPKKNEFNFERLMLCKGLTIYDILREFYFELTPPPPDGYAYIGDKSPKNMRSCTLLANGFRDAKFIHIIRDPRDYALSVNKAWGKNQLRAVFLWVRGILDFQNAIVAAKKPFIEVRYEDLLSDPESTLRRCAEFLGLDYEPGMVHLSEPVERVGDARDAVIKRDNSGKYLREMSPALVQRIDGYCVELLHHYGYPCSSDRVYNKPVPTFMKSVLRALDAVSLVRFHTRQHGFRSGLEKTIRAAR